MRGFGSSDSREYMGQVWVVTVIGKEGTQGQCGEEKGREEGGR